MSVRVDEAIRRRGFRRWYERQLVESHAWLVSGLLALVMMAVALEMTEFRGSAAGLLALAAIAVGGGALCVFAWARFNRQLFRAEHLGSQATCAGCGAYARFEVTGGAEAPGTVAGCRLSVRCRRCGHAWAIE